MTRERTRWSRAAGPAAIVAGLLILPGTAAAQESPPAALLRPFASELAGPGAALFQNLQAQPTTRRARLASLDRSAFAGDRVTLGLFPDLELAAERMDIGYTGIRSGSWTGRLPDGGSAAFVIHGDRISGTVSSPRGNFRFLPLGGGDCVVVEEDAARVPGCAVGRVARPPAGVAATRQASLDRGRDRVAADRSLAGAGAAGTPVPLDTPTGNRVRVLVAYTADAKALTSSVLGQTMQELIDLAVLESNQGYANSGVTMRMELAVLYQTTFNESAAIENDVAKFRDNGDGVMDEVHTMRADYDADMCSLIVDGTDPDWCGWAYDFDYTAYSNMFQATAYNCATGRFSFAHEFGHTQGCRHDDDGTLTPFPYGHGFRNGNNWRTIMAVSGGNSAPRLNYWSNPSINSPVAPFTAMGTAINGNAFRNDCRSALNAGDGTVVDHESTPASSVSPTGDSFSADEYADKLVTGTLTVGSFSALSGSVVQFRAGTSITLTPGFRARSGSSFRARLAGPLGDGPVSPASSPTPGSLDSQ
jgi:hypothetical protein